MIKKRHIAAFGLVLASAVACAPAIPTDNGSADHETVTASGCGVERWPVKTGTDANAGSINTKPQTTTIAALGAIPAPNTLPQSTRVAPVEETEYSVGAFLNEYKLESDGDYHLVLNDGIGHTMIAEIPNPSCVGAGSPLAAGIANARDEFNRRYTVSTSFKTANNVSVVVTGVGFFDFLHGQTGVAPNGIEIHPVLNVQFSYMGG